VDGQLARLPRHLTRMDWLLPLALAVIAVVELSVTQPSRWGIGAVVEVAACAALVARRHAPLLACSTSGILVTTLPWYSAALNDVSTPILVVVAAVYSLARWLPDLRGLAGMGLIALSILSDYLFRDLRDNGLGDVIFVLALLSPPYAFGRVSRKMAVQAEQLRAQQELIHDQAVREERDRIARELHDVIAHSISAMVVQTAAAQDLVRTDPDKAERVLGAVAETGRQALDETGRLLHVLRDSDDELGLAPTPGLADLDTLVAGFREAGLRVEVVVEGEVAGLPAALDTSSYRIVQEALTNALRYAADGAVELHVLAAPDGVTIRSSNVVRAHAHGQGSGLGLAGLAERVALLGGRLSHGLTPAGRFELAAELPMRPVG
jgi:signal transduction histidine kinase